VNSKGLALRRPEHIRERTSHNAYPKNAGACPKRKASRSAATGFPRGTFCRSRVANQQSKRNPGIDGLRISYPRCRSRARPGAHGAFRPSSVLTRNGIAVAAKCHPPSKAVHLQTSEQLRLSWFSFGMKASRNSSRELKRLEEATRKDSRHFVQCPK
jgi:hypothetical protein